MLNRASAGIGRAARAFATTGRSRNLRRIQTSFGAAWTSEWAFTVALAVVAFREGGAQAVGLVAFIRIAPSAVIGPLGSSLGDRFRRDRVLAWSCVVRAVATGTAAVLLAVDAAIVAVYALAILATSAFAVVRPVHSALLPMLCSTPLELTSANVVRGLIDSLSTLVGPLIAALLLDVAGPEAVVGVAAVLSLWAGLLAHGLSYEEPPRRRSRKIVRVLGETADGFRALRRYRDMGTIAWIAVVQVFIRGSFGVLSVVIAVELIETGEPGVGVLVGAVGAGAVAGSLVVSMLVTGRHLAAIEGLGVVLWGVPLALCAALPMPWAVLPLMGLIGVGNALVDVGLFSLPPRFVPEDLLARLFGAVESLAALALAVASLVTPLAIAGLGVRGALVVVGLAAPVAVASVWPRLRAIDASVVRRDEEIDVMRQVAMFRPLPMPAIENLALHSSRVDVAPGTDIVRQGEAGDSFFVIRRGAADVYGNGALIGTMGPGDGFGEIALLRDIPRTATVRARTELSLDRLDRAHFLASVGAYSSSATGADELVSARLDTFDPG